MAEKLRAQQLFVTERSASKFHQRPSLNIGARESLHPRATGIAAVVPTLLVRLSVSALRLISRARLDRRMTQTRTASADRASRLAGHPLRCCWPELGLASGGGGRGSGAGGWLAARPVSPTAGRWSRSSLTGRRRRLPPTDRRPGCGRRCGASTGCPPSTSWARCRLSTDTRRGCAPTACTGARCGRRAQSEPAGAPRAAR